MPEIRHDPLRDFWVLIAPQREARPQEFTAPPVVPPSKALCPFCEGREDQTPPEVLAYRPAGLPANGPGWQLRVVPNLYPAVLPDDSPPLQREAAAAADPEAQQRQPARGRHEVVIETPWHEAAFHELAEDEALRVFQAYRQRLLAFRDVADARYGMFFRNQGAAAGASLAHPHSQLITLPLAPPGVRRQLEGAAAHRQKTGRSYFTDLLSRAAQEDRVVYENEAIVAFCPFASRFPYEVSIMPREGTSHYEASPDALLAGTARSVQRVLAALFTALDDPPYNWLLTTAPFDTLPCDHYHWNIEIFPRLVGIAGFEWGTGCYINPVSPEKVAERLRKTLAAGKAS